VKEDWPNIYKIKYAMADLLYFQKDWAKCGPAFDSVVAENPTAAEAPEAAYASVLCYQNIYEATHKGGEDKKGMGNFPGKGKQSEADKKAEENAKLQPKPLTDNQKGMITAFNRYICYIKPAAGDTTGQDQLVEVKYARARTYFEAQHWEEAAAAFRDIAMNNPDKEVGIYAAQLYLESINVLGSHSNPPRPSCYDDMTVDVPKFVELYCTGEKATKNAEQCTSLAKVQCDVQRLKAQKLVELADKGGPNAIQTYEQAGNTYFELWRKYGEGPLSAGQPGQCEKLDEIVYNSARAFQAARLIAKAIKARMTLLNPQFKMEKGELAKKATREIGGNYQAIAVYDQAAEWFERYARENPKGEGADTSLADAVVLRLGLGDEDAAIKDATDFKKLYGGSKPAQTAAIAFAVGAHYAEKENWDKATESLDGAMGLIAKAAPDIQVQAHATLARSFMKAKHKNQNRAISEYGKVRSLWGNGSAAVAKIKESYPSEDEGQKAKRVGKALTAVGEAYFFNAEEMKKEQVDKIKFPVYHGSGTKDDVVKHISTKVKDWLEKKKPAIDKVAAEYKKIVDLQPEPPPRWVIAAGSRVGLMWGDFVDEFRAAPIPEAWKKDAEMRGVYYDALDAKSEPLKVQFAKPALVTCLTYSVKYQYFDDFSRSCEVWLAKNYKAEYHVVDELRGAPTLSNSGLDEKAPPIAVGGMIWHPQQTGPAEKVAAGTVTSSDDDTKETKKPAGNKGGGGKAAAPAPKKGPAKGLPGQKK